MADPEFLTDDTINKHSNHQWTLPVGTLLAIIEPIIDFSLPILGMEKMPLLPLWVAHKTQQRLIITTTITIPVH